MELYKSIQDCDYINAKVHKRVRRVLKFQSGFKFNTSGFFPKSPRISEKIKIFKWFQPSSLKQQWLENRERVMRQLGIKDDKELVRRIFNKRRFSSR